MHMKLTIRNVSHVIMEDNSKVHHSPVCKPHINHEWIKSIAYFSSVKNTRIQTPNTQTGTHNNYIQIAIQT